MIDKSNGVCAYKQVETAIHTDITRGVYPPGGKLPSEDELTHIYGVSRGTVREALSELSSKGIIRRVHGNGTFVCEKKNEYKIEDDHFISFLDSMENAGQHIVTEILSGELIRADKSQELPFAGEIRVFHLCRMRKICDRCVMLSYDYIPEDMAPDIDRRYKGESSVYDFLESVLGLRICRVKRVFHAVNASETVAGLMGISTGEPLMYVVQEAYDDFGRCVDHARLYLRSDIMQLSVVSSR